MKKLYLYGNLTLTQAGIDKLQKELPKCEIFHDFEKKKGRGPILPVKVPQRSAILMHGSEWRAPFKFERAWRVA